MFSLQWLAVAVDSSLKAALLAFAAAAIVRLLRLRDTAAHHRIWCGVLAGMLLLPLLSQVVPALQVPLPRSMNRLLRAGGPQTAGTGPNEATAMHPVTTHERRAELELDEPPEQALNAEYSLPDDLADRRRADPLSRQDDNAVLARNANQWPGAGFSTSEPGDARDEIGLATVAPRGDESAIASASPPARDSWSKTVRLAIMLLAAVWAGGTLLMTLRLVAGLWLARRLKRQSIAIERPDILGNPCECPSIRVPLTVGFLRPQILLPPTWRGWPHSKLQAVLAHERMHVERGDCAVALVAEINRCLYWFHPLAWWLRQELAHLAEAACDDAVIGATGDRTAYARHLLEVAAGASRRGGRLAPIGVSMARRSNVETRILAILDFTRPLSRQLTWRKSLAIVAVMTPLIALAAALRPAAGERQVAEKVVAEEATSSTAAEPGSEAAEPPNDRAKADQPAGQPIIPRNNDGAAQLPLDETLFTFAGTTIDDRGQPVAGAVISLQYWEDMPQDESLRRLAVSDAQGRFQFTRRLREFSLGTWPRAWAATELIATKEGHGFGIAALPYLETSGRLTSELTERERQIVEYSFGKSGSVLTMPADDVPFRGRVVNSEGLPVAGAKIEVYSVFGGKSGTLGEWETAAKQPNANDRSARQLLRLLSHAGVSQKTGNLNGSHSLAAPAVLTDADGRFTLRGIGRDRIVELFASGPEIATMSVRARTRPGEMLRLIEYPDQPARGSVVYQPAEFTLVAGPTQAVVGRITDKQSGEPLAGMLVQGRTIATDKVRGGHQATHIHALTDAEGRYRLVGLPLGDNDFRVRPPKGSRYLVSVASVSLSAGIEPPVKDIGLTKGVWIRGRVIDSFSGQPLQGSLSYFAFDNNPHLKATKGFDSPTWNYHTEADGRYELPVLPGPGILAFNADDAARYPRGVGADKIDGPKSVTNGIFFLTSPFHVMPINYHLLTALNPVADADEVSLDLSLTPGRSITGRVVDSSGEPQEHYYLSGDQWGGWHRQDTSTFEVKGYVASEGRRITAFDPVRNLVGQLDLTGEGPQSVEVVLRPAATLVGRVVDEAGLPLEGLSLGGALDFWKPGMMGPSPEQKARGTIITHLENQPTLTDKDGRFELKGIIPGRKYALGVNGPRRSEGRSYMSYLGWIAKDATADAGQTKDLGDLRIKDELVNADNDEKQEQPEAPAKEQPKAPPAAGTEPAATNQLNGRVVDARGRAVAGAKIQWFRTRIPDLAPMPPRLMATTNVSGEFQFALPPPGQPPEDESPSWTARDYLVVTAAGHGFVKTSPEELRNKSAPADGLLGSLAKAFVGGSGTSIRLPAAGEPIRGRLVDIDGQPVAGATVKIRWFDDLRPISSWRRGTVSDKEKAAWDEQQINNFLRVIEPVNLRDALPTAVTDAGGRFELVDVGAERLFQLLVQSDSTESLNLAVRNRAGENIKIPPERGFRDTELTLYSRDFVRALGPSKPVTGQVLDLDSKQPIAGAVVRAYAIHGINLHSSRQREEFAARTDREGRFRITGLPVGKDNRLVAFTLGGQTPYIPVGHEVDTSKPGNIQRDFRLKRGVWATGRVYDAETDKPFVGQIEYFWFRDRQLERDIPGLFQAFVDERYWTNTNGEFRVPVLPSRGILAFRYSGWNGERAGIDRFARGLGGDSIAGSQAMGSLKSFPTLPHYLIPVNYERVAEVHPKPGETTVRVDLPLYASKPVQMRVVDAEGKPVSGCEVHGVNERWTWQEIPSADLAVEDLRPGERRKVLVFHRLRNLGGGVIASHEDKQPIEIKLMPAGSLTGRLVDKDGVPITDATLHSDYDKLQTDQETAVWANDEKLFANPDQIPVDSEGRFQLDGLIPGWSYTADATASRKINGQHFSNYGIGSVFTKVRIEPGEKKELGDVRLKEDGADDKEQEQPKEKASPPPAPADDKQAAADRSEAAVGDAPKSRSSQDKPAMAQQPAANAPNAVNRGITAAIDWLAKKIPQPRTVRGQVVDAEKRPIAGAKIEVPWLQPVPQRWKNDARPEFRPRGVTDAEGRFTATLTAQEVEGGTGLAISHPGRCLMHVDLEEMKTDDLGQVVLEPELPITGRLIDAEGRPVAGATVFVESVMAPPKGEKTLDSFLVAWKQESNLATGTLEYLNNIAELLPRPMTDAEGRFTIHGLPAERIAVVDFSAPDYAVFFRFLINRPGFDARPYNDAIPVFRRRFERHLAGPGETLICVPDFKLEGRVTTANGQPVSGVQLHAHLGYYTRNPPRTDDDGRYKLIGLPRGEEQLVGFMPGSGFLSQTIGVKAQPDEAAKTLDVVLKHGITLRGRVTDAVTGEGVRGGIRFVPLQDNEYASQPGQNPFERDHTMRTVNADGSFEFLIIPGPGVVLMQVFNHGPTIGSEQFSIYRTARISEEDEPKIKPRRDGRQFFTTVGGTIEFFDQIQNYAKYVNFEADSGPQTLDIKLDRGKTVELEIVDPAGQPVSNAFVSGLTEQWPIAAQLSEPKTTVYALGADRPRRLVALVADRGLAGRLELTGDESSPVRMQLVKAASLRGRAIDEAGQPLAGVELDVDFQHLSASELYRFHDLHKAKVTTDSEGRFAFSNLLADEEFYLAARVGGDFLLPKPNGKKQLQAGEDRDLGDVTFAPRK